MNQFVFILRRKGEKQIIITKTINGCDVNEMVFGTLYNWGIDEKIAIECASWAELATMEESFIIDEPELYLEVYLEPCE